MNSSVYLRPVRVSIYFFVGFIAWYALSLIFGFASVRTMSIAYMAASLVLTLIVPRVAPRQVSGDLSTPTTSSVLGNLVTRMSTTYLSAEILAGALFIKYGTGRLFFAFFLQLAILIIFISVLSYVMNGDARKAAQSDPFSAMLGLPVGTDRVEQLRRQAYAVPVSVLSDEVVSRVEEVQRAVDAMPEVSYEGTLKIESQIGALMDRLGDSGVKGDSKEARECCRLIVLLVAKRGEYFDDAQAVATAVDEEARKKENEREFGRAYLNATMKSYAQNRAARRAARKKSVRKSSAREESDHTSTHNKPARKSQHKKKNSI